MKIDHPSETPLKKITTIRANLYKPATLTPLNTIRYYSQDQASLHTDYLPPDVAPVLIVFPQKHWLPHSTPAIPYPFAWHAPTQSSTVIAVVFVTDSRL
jgi:hypothetical protein